MHPPSGSLPGRMCRLVLLVVLWLLIGTRSRLLVVGLLSIAESFCRSLCLFGTILVTQCLMVWDRRVSRVEPMLSCWHDLLFFLSPTVLSFSSFHGLVVWGWLLLTDRVFSLSPGLAQRTLNNNYNNNNNDERAKSSYPTPHPRASSPRATRVDD